MPAQTSKSGLLAQYGDEFVEAFNEAKDTPVQLSQGAQLPPGINNGVAHLTDLVIGEYQSGKWKGQAYFRAAATVVYPDTHTWRDAAGNQQTMHVAGRKTQIGPEPLCSTPNRGGDRSRKTLKEHLKWVIDHLRQLGWQPPENMFNNPNVAEETLKRAMASLVKRSANPHTPIYFNFRTWAGKPSVLAKDENGRWCLFNTDGNGHPTTRVDGPYLSETEAKTKNPYAGSEPMINHEWLEVNPHFKLGEPALDSDETGDSDGYNPNTTANNEENGAETLGNADSFKRTEEQEDDAAMADLERAVSGEAEDLGNLAERAEEGESEAKDRLYELAVASGYTDKEIKDADSWADVVDMINQPRGEKTKSPPRANKSESNGEFRVGQPVKYHPIAPKTGKPTTKPVECEITSIDKGKKRLDLKSLRDRKTVYAGIKWAEVVTD